MNHDWTGKLQNTIFRWKKLCSQTFKATLEEVILMHSEKMKAKHMKEDVRKSFFFRNIVGWHLGTSLQINFFTDSFQGFQGLRRATCCSCIKCLKKHLWNNFLLYLVVEFLQLLHEIRCSIKEVFWKTSQNSQINTRRSHPEVFCQKMFWKILKKFTVKTS